LLITTSIALSNESDEEAISELNRLLRTFSEDIRMLEIVPIKEEDIRISFFLYASEYIEWVPLVKIKNRFGLALTSDFAVFEVKKG
jgi:hypothetical protein